MFLHWEAFIKPALDCVDSIKHIVEIGAGKGDKTQLLIEYCRKRNARLTSIDPAPSKEVLALQKEHSDMFTLLDLPSLEALLSLSKYDAILIDGDHNWYTVYHELKLIEKMMTGEFPLVFLHDVAWPYARRDMYYAPDRIPAEYRLEYKRLAMIQGQSELVEDSYHDLCNAVAEGGERNGVRTAVEDFINEFQSQIFFSLNDSHYGLGVLASLDMINRYLPLKGYFSFLDRIYFLEDSNREQSINIYSLNNELKKKKKQLNSILNSRSYRIMILSKRITKRTGVLALVHCFFAMIRGSKKFINIFLQLIKLCDPRNLPKKVNFLKKYGLRAFLYAARNRLYGKPAFDRNIANDIGNTIFDKQQQESASLDMLDLIEKFKQKPLISIIMPMYNSPIEYLEMAVKSLQAQSYTDWELCAVDDGSKDNAVKQLVERMAKHDNRIRLSVMEKNEGISAASNVALEMAHGEYIALMDHDDELTNDALFWIANEINKYPDVDFIYSDECTINYKTREKYNFFCKPSWSPSLLLNGMYTSHLVAYRASLVRQIGGFRSEYDFSQDYDLALRMGDATKNIRHIERILYLWKDIPGSAASGGKTFARQTNMAALQDWYRRNGMNAVISDYNILNDPKPSLPNNLKVSIIIPSDNIDNMLKGIRGILGNTSYHNYEIIVVTNSTTARQLLSEFPTLRNLRICQYNKDFNFSDKCNAGAGIASGNVFCFYNDDVVPISKDWIERMLGILILPGAGGVTPLQVNDDNTILCAASVLGTPGFQTFAYGGIDYESSRWLAIGPHKIRDVSVMSGACIILKKDVFEAIGGFDADNTPNSFSDTDLSLRLMENGYRCVCTPYALMHHDNNTSWYTTKKQDKAFMYMIVRWGKYLSQDVFFTNSMKKLYGITSSDEYEYFTPPHPVVRKQGSRDILFVSHELTRTGAPIALMEMVRAASANGDWPVVMSMCDGYLRQQYLDMGITVIIDKSLSSNKLFVFEYVARNFDLVVVNTLALARVVLQLINSLPPVLWWVHEATTKSIHDKNILSFELGQKIRLYTPSTYCDKSLKNSGLLWNLYRLASGVFDHASGMIRKTSEDSILFLTIGPISLIKGQDILFKAIKMLDTKHSLKAHFVFVGNFYDVSEKKWQMQRQQMAKYANIDWYDNMPQEKLLEIYKKADCLIVPSREDTLSLVTLEAMMFSIPVICSDHVGAAGYITHNENGIVFPSEDHKTLAHHIAFVIDNRDKMEEMGHKGRREIYEKYFTMEKFSVNVLNAINETILISKDSKR